MNKKEFDQIAATYFGALGELFVSGLIQASDKLRATVADSAQYLYQVGGYKFETLASMPPEGIKRDAQLTQARKCGGFATAAQLIHKYLNLSPGQLMEAFEFGSECALSITMSAAVEAGAPRDAFKGLVPGVFGGYVGPRNPYPKAAEKGRIVAETSSRASADEILALIKGSISECDLSSVLKAHKPVRTKVQVQKTSGGASKLEFFNRGGEFLGGITLRGPCVAQIDLPGKPSDARLEQDLAAHNSGVITWSVIN